MQKIPNSAFIRLNAKSDSGFVGLISSVFEYPYTPLALILGAQLIESCIIDQRILAQKPLKAIKVVELIEQDHHKSGRYIPETQTILLRENVAMRMSALQVFIHEYGHHLDESWLTDRPEREPAIQEYEAERKRVELLIGEDLGSDIDDKRSALLTSGTNATSIYALRTEHEWMAEAFALYFSGYGHQLLQRCPATYEVINALCTGKLNVIQANSIPQNEDLFQSELEQVADGVAKRRHDVANKLGVKEQKKFWTGEMPKYELTFGGPASSKGPGSGNYIHKQKHDVIVYHGTSAERTAYILKKGLDPNAPKQYEVSEPGVVYATERLDLAQRFASEDQIPGMNMYVGKHNGHVLKLALSQEEYKKFEVDPAWRDARKNTASMYKGKITPNHIVGVASYDADEDQWTDFYKPKDLILTAAATVTLYVPYLGPKEDIINFCNATISAGGPPSDKGPGSGNYVHQKHTMTQIGSQKGSNAGGFFQDDKGQKYYVKFYKDMNQGKTEVLANKVFNELGIPAVKSFVSEINGKMAVAAPLIDGPKSMSPSEMKNSKDVRAGFVADAYMSNYDVVGLVHDNIMHSTDGHDYRIDQGGTFFYRAQGKAKNPPSDSIPELDSMRDPKIAAQAGPVFKDIPEVELKQQAQKLISVLTDDKIKTLVHESGFTGADAEKHINHMISRREALAQRFATPAGPAFPVTPAPTYPHPKMSQAQKDAHDKTTGSWKFLKYGETTKLTKYESTDGTKTLGIAPDGVWTIFDKNKKLVATGTKAQDFNK